MLTAPFFGWLADRMSRWTLVGIAVILWSAATGASGLAFDVWRVAGHAIVRWRGGSRLRSGGADDHRRFVSGAHARSAMAWFYMAIPVGTALGYMISSGVAWITPTGDGRFTRWCRQG